MIPNVNNAINEYAERITFIKSAKTRASKDRYNSTPEVIKQEKKSIILAMIRPYKPKALELEILATRTSAWLVIHTKNLKFILEVKDSIEYKKVKYEVMMVEDSSKSGFMLYKVANSI